MTEIKQVMFGAFFARRGARITLSMSISRMPVVMIAKMNATGSPQFTDTAKSAMCAPKA